jgi:hypothetical protein
MAHHKLDDSSSCGKQMALQTVVPPTHLQPPGAPGASGAHPQPKWPAMVARFCCQARVVSQTRADQTARKKNRCISTDGNWLAQRLRHLTMSEPPHHRPAVPPHRRWMRTGSPYELPGPPLPERQRLPDNRIPPTGASVVRQVLQK